MLLAVNPDKNFIDEERCRRTRDDFRFSLRAYNAPNLIHQRRIASRLTSDAALGQEVFDVAVAQD